MKLICLVDESRDADQLSDCLSIEWTSYLFSVRARVSLCPISLQHSSLSYRAVIHLREEMDNQTDKLTVFSFSFFFSSLMLFTKLSVPCLFMLHNYLIVFYVSGAFLWYTVLLLCFMFQQKMIIAINRSSKFLLSYAKLQCTRSKAVNWTMNWTVGHTVLCEIASFVWYYEKYCLGLWQEILWYSILLSSGPWKVGVERFRFLLPKCVLRVSKYFVSSFQFVRVRLVFFFFFLIHLCACHPGQGLAFPNHKAHLF